MKAKDAFKAIGKNVMTPHVIDYYDLPNSLVELSEGEGFEHEPLYGVTVLDLAGQLDTEQSQLFRDKDEAREYIVNMGFSQIKEMIKNDES